MTAHGAGTPDGPATDGAVDDAVAVNDAGAALTRPAQAARAAARVLTAAGVPSAEHDARALAEHVLGSSLLTATAALRGAAARDFSREYSALIERRAERVPLQHLTGVMHFRYLTLPAGPGVFVVRPETEVLVDHALAYLADVARAGLDNREQRADEGGIPGAGRCPGGQGVGGDGARVVDLCTGSGAIALAIATERRGVNVWAVELSEVAAARAAANAEAHARELAAAGSTMRVVAGDATATGEERVLPELDGLVDLVVSNPPYIPPDAVPVDPEVRDHDPEMALYGQGEDGLAIPAGVLRRAWELLRPGGAVLMEHADVQGAAARELAASIGYEQAATLPDLTGRDRFLWATRP